MDLPAKRGMRYLDPKGKPVDRARSESIRSVVACVGEALWDLRAPEDKPLEKAEFVRLEPGGGAANVSLGLVKLGVPTKIVAAAGDDLVGRALVARLSDAGIDVSLVRFAKPRTGLVWLSSSPPGAVSYRSSKEEALALRGALPASFGAKIVHISGLLPSRALLSSLVRAARRAREEGALVTMDVNLRPRLWTKEAVASLDLKPLFGAVDLLKASEDDLRVLGLKSADALRTNLRPSAILVSTNGPRSTSALGPFGDLFVDVSPLDVKSAIGAGDAFVVGLLSTLAAEESGDLLGAPTIRRALQRGNTLAREMLLARLGRSK